VQYKRDRLRGPETTPWLLLGLAEKDLRLIDQLATESGTPMPQAAVNLDSIRAAEASIGPESDFAGLARHLRGERRP
jgi:3-hydroxyisobutyrate dehydrogenase-like beta-hydroxyacid dehydrogenase